MKEAWVYRFWGWLLKIFGTVVFAFPESREDYGLQPLLVVGIGIIILCLADHHEGADQ